MDKIKKYKDFKSRDYILNEVSDIVEGTLAYLSDEGYVFSTEIFFNDILIFVNKPSKGESPPFDYDTFSWLDVKEYVISLFERLHKRFADSCNIKVYLKIGNYHHGEEITYQEMLNSKDDDIKIKGLTNIFGVNFCLL